MKFQTFQSQKKCHREFYQKNEMHEIKPMSTTTKYLRSVHGEVFMQSS